jgi:hypothetical protein
MYGFDILLLSKNFTRHASQPMSARFFLPLARCTFFCFGRAAFVSVLKKEKGDDHNDPHQTIDVFYFLSKQKLQP